MKVIKYLYHSLASFFISLFVPIWIFSVLILALFVRIRQLFSAETKKSNPRLVWGPDPLINNRYWANAMKLNGYAAESFVYDDNSFICKSKEFDKTLESTIPFYTVWKNPWIYRLVGVHIFRWWTPYFALMHMIMHYDVFHFSFNGGVLRNTILAKYEPVLLKFCGKKTVVSPFGSDAYCYSEIKDPSLQHALLMSQIEYSKKSKEIRDKVEFWSKHADAIISGGAIDGLPRWDVLAQNHLCIDLDLWQPKTTYSDADGRNGTVKVYHTPNHRGFKGTEFLIEAVEQLKNDGLKVELVLLEKVDNHEVRRQLREEADILAEQFIYSGYALSGIEGMVSGLPVMANLDTEVYAKLFRRYSFLGDCPIVSTNVESIRSNLEKLITNPTLRKEIGQAGRKYVEKYHSPEAAQYLFGSIYRKIWFEENVDLLKLFHPLRQSGENNE